MFERRLRLVLGVLAAAMFVLAARLVDLQILRADEFRRRAEEVTRRRPQSLPFARGSILDRSGRPLAYDQPCWDVCVDYAVIALEPEHVAALVRAAQRQGRYPGLVGERDIEAALRADIDRMWDELAAFEEEGTEAWRHDGTREAVLQRAAEIRDRVERIQQAVSRRAGYERDVREEYVAHPFVTGLSHERHIEARLHFRDVPWVEVNSSWQRAYTLAEPFAHVLGGLAAVSADDIASDPHKDQPFARYLPSETIGVSGVEWLAETALRGRRGALVERDGRRDEQESVDAVNGQDVRLTIRADLQARLYDVLRDATLSHPDVPAGSIVVLDVATRDVLALVSYPAYDPGALRRDYDVLADQTAALPLLFRAVGCGFAPGSIVKPLVCLAGADSGIMPVEKRVNCQGYLNPSNPSAWRCWEVAGTGGRKAHGDVNVVEALRGSCNVFMYHVGQSVGFERLYDYFQFAGIGETTGSGLREETPGRNPTPAWLSHHDLPITPGMLRNLAIGQGDLLVTPLQAANLMAFYADGRKAPVRLLAGATAGPVYTRSISPQAWSAIREGLYLVVNDPDGTAYDHARLEDDRYALCGKTGSATVHPRPTQYEVVYTDALGDSPPGSSPLRGEPLRVSPRSGEPPDGEHTERIPAGSRSDAVARFERRYPPDRYRILSCEPALFWPPNTPRDERLSHAWFCGFLQPLGPDHRPDWRRTATTAFAVLLEYGGSGGRVSGPVARQVAGVLLDTLGADLDPDAPPLEATEPS